MGTGALIAEAHRFGVTYQLMPTVAYEATILLGGIYFAIVAAAILLLYFVWVYTLGRVSGIRDRADAWRLETWTRAKAHPVAYLTLATLAVAVAAYAAPSGVAPFLRSTGLTRSLCGTSGQPVASIRIEDSSIDLGDRSLTYLWQRGDHILLRDASTGELLILKVEDVASLVLAQTP